MKLDAIEFWTNVLNKIPDHQATEEEKEEMRRIALWQLETWALLNHKHTKLAKHLLKQARLQANLWAEKP